MAFMALDNALYRAETLSLRSDVPVIVTQEKNAGLPIFCVYQWNQDDENAEGVIVAVFKNGSRVR